MPTARYGLVVGSPGNGKIYAMGGTAGNDQGLAINEEYTPSTTIWAVRAPLPTPRRFAAAAAAGGKLFVIGGVLSGTILAVNEEYDPATDSWHTRAPMPTPRFLLAVTSVNGKVYAFGGVTALFNNISGSFGRVIYLNDVEIYDPTADKWTKGTPMPTARAGCGAASPDNGMIYVSGGYDGTRSLFVTERYNPLLDAWKVRAPLTICGSGMNTTQGLAMVAPLISTSVFVIGGENSASAVYDIGGNWISTGTIFRGNQRYERDMAALVAKVEIMPNPVNVGCSSSVTLYYVNVGDVAVTALVPSIGVTTGGVCVGPPSGPYPSPGFTGGLSPGDAAYHAWVYPAIGAGQVTFCGQIDGTDSLTTAAVSAKACNLVPLVTAYESRLACGLKVSPLPLAVGGTLEVVLTVANSGGGTTYDTSATLYVGPGGSFVRLLTGPSLSVTVYSGSTASFTWTFSVLAGGYAVFTATATGTDPYFGSVIGRAVKTTQPSTPAGFSAVAADRSARLTWDPNPSEEAVIRYLVYRGMTRDFTASSANQVGTVSGNSFDDSGLVNGTVYYYRIVAESAEGIGLPTAPLQARPLSMPGEPGGVRITNTGPNPLKVNPSRGDCAQVLVNVPAGAGTLRITIYNLAGETIRILREEPAPPGPLICDWDGRNDHGRPVASGGYIVVVELPDGKRTVRKVAIVR
jgi:hypothetical protein